MLCKKVVTFEADVEDSYHNCLWLCCRFESTAFAPESFSLFYCCDGVILCLCGTAASNEPNYFWLNNICAGISQLNFCNYKMPFLTC
jgi:hypothetical protein